MQANLSAGKRAEDALLSFDLHVLMCGGRSLLKYEGTSPVPPPPTQDPLRRRGLRAW